MISGGARFRDQLVRLGFDGREFLLDVVEGTIRVTVDRFEGKAPLEGLEALENGRGDGRSALVQRVRVRVGGDVSVRSVESVFDYRIAVGLRRDKDGPRMMSKSGSRASPRRGMASCRKGGSTLELTRWREVSFVAVKVCSIVML